MSEDIDRTQFVTMFGEDAVPQPEEMPEYCEHAGDEEECICDPDDPECDPECAVCSHDGDNPILGAFLHAMSRAEHLLEEHGEGIPIGEQVRLWALLASEHRHMLTD